MLRPNNNFHFLFNDASIASERLALNNFKGIIIQYNMKMKFGN